MNTETLIQARDAAVEELHTRKGALDMAERAIAEAGDDADLTQLRTAFDEAAASFDDAATEVERCKKNLADAERRAKVLEDNPATARAAVPAVRTVEPAIYSEETAHTRSFFRDAWAYKEQGDPEARERLERHGRQVTDELRSKGIQSRSVGTAGFSGLTIPQYLVDLFAPLARAGAPALATVRKIPLPDSGLSIVISRLTTGTAVAAQASENAGVNAQDPSDTSLTVNIRTYAGQTDVSRQAIERSEMVDAVVFQDLIADYFTKLDNAILNGAGTSGTHLGIANVSGIVTKSFTNGSPTVPLLYPKVADAIQSIASTRYAPATTIFMHPRRWGWLTAGVDSSSRPYVVPQAQGPFNALAVGDAPEYGAVVGTMQGLPVITDANIITTDGAGTNQDQIFVSRVPDLLFFQDGDGMPRQLSFEQSNAPQSIRLAVWGYSAFTAGRYPAASALITGTGLTTPTF